MILLPATRRIFAATEPVDMRRSFDVLYEIARQQLGLDAMRSAVVLFFNRPRTHCKPLFHDGTGFVMLYKRLDERTFSVPKPTARRSVCRHSARRARARPRWTAITKIVACPEFSAQPPR